MREKPSISKLQIMRAVKPRLVKTTQFVKKIKSQVASTDSELDKALRETYIPYLFGKIESLDPMVKALVYTIPTHKLAERAVAKMFELELPSDNTHGYDLDTTGLEWDGVDYGKIEIRTRSLRETVQYRFYESKRSDWEATYEYVRFRADFVTSVEMKRKRANPADWFFCALFDPKTKKLVWFRFPGGLVFDKNTLTVTKSKDGGYGWADYYLWVGPENEKK